MPPSSKLCAVAGLILCLSAASASAQTAASAAQPSEVRWEAGLALLGFRVPQHPASEDQRSLVLPAPYFVYRGRVLRAEQRDSRLRYLLNPNVELSFSAGGAFSANSDGSEARDGMPDLGYLFELGPKLRLGFEAPGHEARVLLDLPVRGVVSIDGGVDWRGLRLAPELSWEEASLAGRRLSLRLSLGAEFGSTPLQRYFYEVPERYATPARPAYEATAGYLGSSVGLRLNAPLGRRLRGFVSLRYHRHDGAANQDSPLFRSEDGLGSVIGLSWSFLQSAEYAVPE